MSALDFVTDHDLADRLGRSVEFVQRQCRTKAWPHLRVGRSYRFTDSDISAIADLLRVQPAPQKQAAASWGRRGRGAS